MADSKISALTAQTALADDDMMVVATAAGATKKMTGANVKAATLLVTENIQTASYTLVLTDASKCVVMNVGSANNLTVPTNASVAFPVGTTIEVFQLGAGQTTFVMTSLTSQSPSGKLKLTGQYSSATLRKRATDTWAIAGDLSA